MNTKQLMTASAITMGIAGLILTFLPGESARWMGLKDCPDLLLQLAGALYVGFAMLNWTAKGNLIGGIYSKPVALGNYAHFFIGAFALLKMAIHEGTNWYLYIATTIYVLFAALFGFVSFSSPLKKGA